ncbi:MAG: hypothetical protein U1E76_18230 [Planctomycetota bacterium]
MHRLAWTVMLTCAAPAFAGGNADSTIWSGVKQDPIDSAWVVQYPTGSADYFDATYHVVAGSGNVAGASIAGALPITAVAVSVADFGSGRVYPRVGAYRSNLALDPSGESPDLAAALAELASPAFAPPPLYDFVAFDTPEGAIPSGDTRVHAVVQLPPGDSGLLGVGADSTTAAVGSGFTTDGYTTPSVGLAWLDFGLNVGQDNSTTTSCKPADRAPHGRLRAGRVLQGIGEGDQLTVPVRPGQVLQLAFFGPQAGDRWRLYLSLAPCTPSQPIGPILSTVADPDADGSYMRLSTIWPSGFGGMTLRFAAAWGNPACSNPGAGFTNCVTIITADTRFGVCDDGTIESGWVVSIPAGPSDYFSNNFGAAPPSVNYVTGLCIAAIDFGATTAAFPAAGVSLANLGVDPSGSTPDIGSPLALIAPFSFAPGTYTSTSAGYACQPCSIPGSLLSGNVHGWAQLAANIAVGADTTSINGCSFFSTDGYATPAQPVPANLGIRLTTN